MALLSGRPVRLVDPEGLSGRIWPNNIPSCSFAKPTWTRPWPAAGPAVYVGFRERAWPPEWLVLRPRNLVVGMGCHKGTPAAEILEFIKDTFKQARLSLSVPEGPGHH